MHAITVDNISFGYEPAVPVVRDVSLTVRPGEFLSLVGPNGSGKSTVLKTVSGLLRPKRGTVTFRDQVINKLSPKARLLLGIVHVPQDRSLFPAMSVWDNLLMGGYMLRDQKLLQQRLEQAVEAFPICRARAREHAGSLSGMMNMMGNIGGALCPLVIGYILYWTHNNWNLTFYVSAAIYLMGAICWMFLDPVTPLEH